MSAFPAHLADAIRRVDDRLRDADSYGTHANRDVTNACCAAWAYGDAYLRSGIDIAYLFAVAEMLRMRFAIPMTLITDMRDPLSIEARARLWRAQYAREDRQ
jgi:hypothetical protein